MPARFRSHFGGGSIHTHPAARSTLHPDWFAAVDTRRRGNGVAASPLVGEDLGSTSFPHSRSGIPLHASVRVDPGRRCKGMVANCAETQRWKLRRRGSGDERMRRQMWTEELIGERLLRNERKQIEYETFPRAQRYSCFL